MTIISELIEALLGLLPSNKDNIATWLVKVFVVALMFFLSAFFAYHVMINTSLGSRYGIQLNTRIPLMTHVEQNIIKRSVWQQLAELRYEDESISSVFLMMLIDKKTNNFPLKELPTLETDLILWEFEVPARVFPSLEIIEDMANTIQNEVQPLFDKSQKCMSAVIPPDRITLIKRSLSSFPSSHVVGCPIYTFYNRRLVGFTIAFYELKPPYTNFFYEDKLRATTRDISTRFRTLDNHYEIIAD